MCERHTKSECECMREREKGVKRERECVCVFRDRACGCTTEKDGWRLRKKEKSKRESVYDEKE